jgi:hypothetical protein
MMMMMMIGLTRVSSRCSCFGGDGVFFVSRDCVCGMRVFMC